MSENNLTPEEVENFFLIAYMAIGPITDIESVHNIERTQPYFDLRRAAFVGEPTAILDDAGGLPLTHPLAVTAYARWCLRKKQELAT